MSAFVQSFSAERGRRSSHAAVAEMEPLQRGTLGDRVMGELRGLLISGRLAPGEKLSLRTIAQALGVSMMPVRAAVGALAADGALEVLPGKAVRVPELTVEQFRELTKVRIALEGYAAEEAARNATDVELAEIARLETSFRRIVSFANPDSGAAVNANSALHFAVYRASRMPLLVGMIEGLWLKAGPILNIDMRHEPERLERGHAVVAHADLLLALQQRKPAQARKALESDVRAAAEHIEATGRLPIAPTFESAGER